MCCKAARRYDRMAQTNDHGTFGLRAAYLRYQGVKAGESVDSLVQANVYVHV